MSMVLQPSIQAYTSVSRHAFKQPYMKYGTVTSSNEASPCASPMIIKRSVARWQGMAPISEPSSPNVSPNGSTRPASWQDTLDLLSAQLNSICQTPTAAKRHSAAGTISLSPQACEKKVSVSHIQSEEKLREKLSTIVYGSPRGVLPGGSVTPEPRSPQPVRRYRRSTSNRKKNSSSQTLFRKQISIGESGIEDLTVRIENGIFHVKTTCPGFVGELPVAVELPNQVSPDLLICIIRNGTLEVRENRKRPMVGSDRISPRSSVDQSNNNHDIRRTVSHDPRRSCSVTGQPPMIKNCERTPIVLESDDTTQLKLVMQIPDGYTMEDIHLKTVNTHLIVSAMHCKNSEHDMANRYRIGARVSANDEVFQIFELPERVDPYSVEARLTDKQKLVITVALLPL